MSPQAEGRPIGATPDGETVATLAAVRRFLDAFARHDVDGIMAAMTEDCVFENTYPPPDGERHVGQAAVRGFWERFFRDTPSAAFETEEMFAGGARCAVRWLYRWRNADGSAGHVRGVDLLRVRDGKVVEKLSYVKG
jgi:ketosteroid isomerase-like protein